MTNRTQTTSFDPAVLDKFYKLISSENGIHVMEFQKKLNELFELPRSENDDMKDYRIGRGSWKELRDEVVPVSRYLDYQKIEDGRLKFSLDNEPLTDCLYWKETDENPTRIEVTASNGKERFYINKELNKGYPTKGFLGLGDDENDKKFKEAIEKPDEVHLGDTALDFMKKGIIRCLEKKEEKLKKYIVLRIKNQT